MKAIKYLLLFLFTPLCVLAGDVYSPPQVHLKDREIGHVQVKEGSWDGQTGFRVQERPFSERSIASDEVEEVTPTRDPSSISIEDLKFEADVQRWKWQDKL